MSVMYEDDVIVVGDNDMSASFAMSVVVSGMLSLAFGDALIEMAVVGSVKVPALDIVDMVSVRDCHMPASIAMNMVVTGVLDVRTCHRCSSRECLIASLTM